MSLPANQLVALKADLLTNTGTIPAGFPWSGSYVGLQVKDVPADSDGNVAVAGWYSLAATPAFWVWRRAITQNDVLNQVSVDGTTFDWASTGGFIARSQGERDAFRQIFAAGAVNPSLASIRAAFTDIFSGSGVGAINNRNHIESVSRRTANRIEKLLSTGTGSTASPATMGYEGVVTGADIEAARVA